ncbi:hypothetical protein BHE74_00020037 [Ensete ventricosum]|nr:hypothetical protein BHE74_00020037 [Ensete ventricosum]
MAEGLEARGGGGKGKGKKNSSRWRPHRSIALNVSSSRAAQDRPSPTRRRTRPGRGSEKGRLLEAVVGPKNRTAFGWRFGLNLLGCQNDTGSSCDLAPHSPSVTLFTVQPITSCHDLCFELSRAGPTNGVTVTAALFVRDGNCLLLCRRTRPLSPLPLSLSLSLDPFIGLWRRGEERGRGVRRCDCAFWLEGMEEEEEEEAKKERNEEVESDGGAEMVRVLVVDDSPVDRKIVEMLLKKSGRMFEAEDFILKPLKVKDVQRLRTYAVPRTPISKSGTKRKLPVDLVAENSGYCQRVAKVAVA